MEAKKTAKKTGTKPTAKKATKEKGPKAYYNDFYKKFWQRPGHLGSLTKNAAGKTTFNIFFDSLRDTDEAIAYLEANGGAKEVWRNTVEPRRAFFIL